MEGYICAGWTDIKNVNAFRVAARRLGYRYNDVILNVMEYGQVDIHVKNHVDINKLLQLGKEILKKEIKY